MVPGRQDKLHMFIPPPAAAHKLCKVHVFLSHEQLKMAKEHIELMLPAWCHHNTNSSTISAPISQVITIGQFVFEYITM